MELIPVFLFTLLICGALVLALLYGRPPAYRPTRESVEKLLEQLLEGEASQSEWDLFIGMPIQHDEALEQIRQSCVILHEGLDGNVPARSGIDGYIYDRAGRVRIERILDDLREVIRDTPVVREF